MKILSIEIRAFSKPVHDSGARVIMRTNRRNRQFRTISNCHEYPITNKLRMLRALSLQSAFLAKGGTL